MKKITRDRLLSAEMDLGNHPARGRISPTIFSVLSLLVLSFWLAPRARALYHREQGGRLLIRALLAEDRQADRYEGLFFPEPLAEPRARSLVEAAHRRFLAATAADPAGARAHLWSGRTAWLLGNPAKAAEALSTYVRLQPGDPDGWWELGLIYGRLDQQVRRATYWALIPDPDDMTEMILLGAANVVTATLSAAEVETPDTPVETPYCGRGKEPRSCFVAPAAWAMPDASAAQPAGWWLLEEPVRRSVLFMHPPARATFTVTLPVTPTALVFWMGMDPAAWERLGDGVVYRVRVNGEVIFDHVLTATEARQGWWPEWVKLSPWIGQTVRLTLETDPGPDGDGRGDWAGWGEVRLVDVSRAALAAADLNARVIGAWGAGGITEQELLTRGKRAFSARRYQEALWWFGRGAEIEPSSAQPWYYVGRAYEGLKKPFLALVAFRQAVRQRDSERIVSSLYFHIGWLLQTSRAGSPFLDTILGLYEAALAADRFVGHWERVGTHYSRGDVLRRMGRLQEAIEEFRWVVKERPEHYWGNVWLGVVLWQADGDVEEAEKYLRQAIALKPEVKWAYRWLGEIYQKTGRWEEAEAVYRQVLEIDPQDQAALQFLAEQR